MQSLFLNETITLTYQIFVKTFLSLYSMRPCLQDTFMNEICPSIELEVLVCYFNVFRVYPDI